MDKEQRKIYHTSLLQIIFAGCIAGGCYELGAFIYREEKYKNIFKFVRKFPGFTVMIGTSAGCLGAMYANSLRTIKFPKWMHFNQKTLE